MDQLEFWGIIDASRQSSPDDLQGQAGALVRVLTAMPVNSIVDFERHFLRFMANAYDARLWAAGCILDELSDDGFTDFRAWLISRGQDVYARCLDDPQHLAQVVAPGERVTAEEINSVAFKAYAAKTGRDDFFTRFHFEASTPLKNPSLSWQAKEGYPDPERLCVLFPRLCERFGRPT